MKQFRSDRIIDLRGAVGWVAGLNERFIQYYHELTVLSPCKLPEGPVILACNHTAGVDPMLIQSAVPRLVVWMMASEYYELRAFRPFFKLVEAIPVDRDGRDMAATRAALRALKDGRVLGIFPEGRIETDRQLLPFQPGAALLALKSGAAVVPAYLDGNQRGREMVPSVLRKCEATLAFGPPVQFDRSEASREAAEAATDAIRRSILDLRHRTLKDFDNQP